MKHFSLLVFIISVSVIVRAQNRAILFEQGTTQDVFAKARVTNRLIFVDCFTEWCVPCKGMAATVFTKDSVADFFNKTFINVKMDMEKGEGPVYLKKYKVGAFPTYLLLDAQGNLVYKFIGGMSADSFLLCIKRGLDPRNKVVLMNQQYAGGNRSKPFLRDYIKLKIEMQEIKEAQMLSDEYFNMLTPEEKVLPDNWYLFGENRYELYLSSVGSVNFDYLAGHWKSFVENNGKQTVELKLGNTYRKIAGYALRNWYFKENANWLPGIPRKIADFKRYRSQIEATQLEDKNDLIVLMNMAEAAALNDTVGVVNLLADHFTSFYQRNRHIFYDILPLIPGNNAAMLKYPRTKELFEKVISSSTEEAMINLAKTYLKRIPV